MKICAKCKIEKDLNKFCMRRASRDGLKSRCKICANNDYTAWAKKNPKKIKTRNKLFRKENPDYSAIYLKENPDYKTIYNKKHAEEIKVYWTVYRKKNSKKLKAYISLYAKKNSDVVNAINAKRRASKLRRTPFWLTRDNYKEIYKFYMEAQRKTKETGIRHDVDHIVPLQGEMVSGLHVPWNLQILTKSNNCSKGNRM